MRRILCLCLIVVSLFMTASVSEARWYSPETGRFLTRDPLGFAGGDTNLYRFVGNNPVNFIDPWGLAHFGKRPLADFPGMINNPVLDYLNKEVSHEHIWFDDNIVPSNVGFGPDGLFPELGIAKKYYQMSPEYFDDALLRIAYKNVTPGNYCLLVNNCQNWAERVREEYRRLEEEQYKNCP